VTEVADAIVLTPISHHGVNGSTVCTFPTLPDAPQVPFNELVTQADDTRKSGCHDPVGMLAFYGAAVRPGLYPTINNVDAAPTLLNLLGVAVPAAMKGKDVSKAFLRS
jgi:hypothetical protein